MGLNTTKPVCRVSEMVTSLLGCRDYLENLNVANSKFGYDPFQYAKNKGADQTAQMQVFSRGP